MHICSAYMLKFTFDNVVQKDILESLKAKYSSLGKELYHLLLS